MNRMAMTLTTALIVATISADAATKACITSSGTQKINTGYVVSANTVIDMTFDNWTGGNDSCVFGFGVYSGKASLLMQQNSNLVYWGNNTKLATGAAGTAYHVHVEGSENTYITANGARHVVATVDTSVENANKLYLFANGTITAGNCKPGSFSLYDCRMWDRAGGKLVRDFVPCTSNGAVGLYDRVESKFYGNAGTSTFALTGAACTFDGTNLTVGDDVLFSYVDGQATDYELPGTLTLGAGARLEFEVAGPVCDSIKVNALALTATEANPVVIAVAQVKAGFVSTGASRTLLAGGNLTAADLGKFALESRFPFALSVEKGNLVLTLSNEKMPAGFRTLRSIRSNGQQRISTGHTMASTDTITCEFGQLKTDGNADGVALFGTDAWAGDRSLLILQNKAFTWYGSAQTLRDAGNYSATSDYRFETYYANGSKKVSLSRDLDVPTVKDGTDNASGANDELTIFGFSKDRSRCSTMALYSMTIKSSDGRIMRDFVPCQKADGEIGLWDCAEGRFYGNTDKGRFLLSEEGAPFYSLDYIESTGTQAIDTGYVPKSATILEMHFGSWKSGGDRTVFGANVYSANAYLLLQQGDAFRYYGSGAGYCSTTANTDFFVHVEPNNFVMSNGTDTKTDPTQASSVDAGVTKSLSLFAMREWNGAFTRFAQYRLYDCSLWASKSDFDAKKSVRQFAPCYDSLQRAAGLLDKTTGYFYGNANAAATAQSFVYDTTTFFARIDGTKLEISGLQPLTAGKLPADCTEVALVNANTLDSTELLRYPALTLDTGAFSLKNGQSDTCAVIGKFTVRGGAKLVLDAQGGIADMIEAGSVDLSGASRENPVLVDVGKTGSYLGATKILSVTGLAKTDAEKFLAPGLTAKFKVRDDGLYLQGQTGLFIVVK